MGGYTHPEVYTMGSYTHPEVYTWVHLSHPRVYTGYTSPTLGYIQG